MSFFLFDVSAGLCCRDRCDLLYLHDLSKASLSDDLEKLKVVNGKSVLSVLDKVDADLHGTTTELDADPVGASLASRYALPLLVLAISLLLESRVDLQCTDKDVLVPASVGRCSRVANVERDGKIGYSGNIELVLCVTTSPQGIFWCARNSIDENLLLVEIDQGIGQVF